MAIVLSSCGGYKEPAKTPQLAAGMKAGFSFLDIYV